MQCFTERGNEAMTDLNQLQNAEFKEAFDEFDKVVRESDQ